MSAPQNGKTVFYSWQSDLPEKMNRYLVRDALKESCEALSEELEEAVRADSDTQGVAGIEEIHRIILRKLELVDAAIFDVSPVCSTPAGKPVPNPNVMVELGYAMAKNEFTALAMVMNLAHGEPKDLPFDIRNRRVITFRCKDPSEIKDARASLVREFTTVIRALLQKPPRRGLAEQVAAAIRSGAPDATLQTEEFTDTAVTELLSFRPSVDYPDLQAVQDSLSRALVRLPNLFVVLHAALRVGGDAEFLRHTKRLFERLLLSCETERPESEVRSSRDFERLLTRDIFVRTVDLCAQAERYGVIGQLCRVSLRHMGLNRKPASLPFPRIYMGAHTISRSPEGRLRLGSVLAELYGPTGVASSVGFERIRSAEFLVFFHESAGRQRTPRDLLWIPTCLPSTAEPPLVVASARTAEGAAALAAVIDVPAEVVSVDYKQSRETALNLFPEIPWAYPAQFSWPKQEEIGKA